MTAWVMFSWPLCTQCVCQTWRAPCRTKEQRQNLHFISRKCDKKMLRGREEKDAEKSKLLVGTRSKVGEEDPPGKRDARRQDINSVRAKLGSGRREGREVQNNFGSTDLFMFLNWREVECSLTKGNNYRHLSLAIWESLRLQQGPM